MKRFSALLVAISVTALAQAQTSTTDMKTLVGRSAVVQRTPFYQPGTYQEIPKTYAGQTVTIVEVKPSAMFAMMPTLTPSQMASLPPQSQQAIENTKTASVIVVQFQDGTRADTGAMPVMASTLPMYLELLPDKNPSPAVPTSTKSAATTVVIPLDSSCPETATKALCGQTTPKQLAISDAFAKAAMRLVIAIKDSDGSLLAEQHVRVIDEEAEMEQATPEERAILQDLALRQVYYQLDSKMELATVSPYDSSPSQANLDAQKTFKADIDCFFAYIPSLKSLSGSIPPLCLANDAKRTADSKRAEDEQDKAQCDKEQRTDCKPAREQSVLERNLKVRLDLCIDVRGKNGKDAKAIAKCNAAYDKEMKEHEMAK